LCTLQILYYYYYNILSRWTHERWNDVFGSQKILGNSWNSSKPPEIL